MRCCCKTISFWAVMAFLCAALFTSDCHADCLACWQLKGVVVHLKNGTTIKGYATWNDSWAELGYSSSNDEKQVSRRQARETKRKFPEVIFDPRAKIERIYIYTHLRSIKYPVRNALVAVRKFIPVNVKDIKDLKLHSGPHDGYNGAGSLPVVSDRIADLLQTKPAAFCQYDTGLGDGYCISYDKNFPEKELQRLCKEDKWDDKTRNNLKSRDIFCLYWAYD